MEADYFLSGLSSIDITVNPLTITIILNIFFLVLLLIFSGLISGSETAFFSLSPAQINDIKESKNNKIINHLYKPNKLLATILISNNFINIGIVILSTYINNSLFDFSHSPTIGFIFQIIIVTFLLLLFGEIIPKVYASQNAISLCNIMSHPLKWLSKIFFPVVSLLTNSTILIDKHFGKKENISLDELAKALTITYDDITEEKEILKGIVNFTNTSTEEIMTPRVNIIAIEINTNFNSVRTAIIKYGFSRLPIYSETLDNIKGILYTKDLLPHIDKEENFKWQELIRQPYFVPETKKINDLLKEFQERKMHMAFIIDEYGGCSGIITMEDILEEIVGEISDEFDYDYNYDMFYIEKNGSYIFEANIQLNDFFKVIKINNDSFDNIKGDADTLAGLILEIKKDFPKINDIIIFNNFKFTVTEVGNRRIKKVRFKILKENNEK